MMAAPAVGEGYTRRGELAVQYADALARVEALKPKAAAAAPTLDDLEGRYAEADRRTALSAKMQAEILKAPEGSDRVRRVIDDQLALTETDPARPVAPSEAFTWSDFDKVMEQADSPMPHHTARLREAFQEAAVAPYAAATLARAWAEPPLAEVPNWRERWGADADVNEGLLQRLILDRASESNSRWVAEGIVRRPAVMAEFLRLAKQARA
jgi:hypothetical protein